MKFYKTNRHHRQIGRSRAFADKLNDRVEERFNVRPALLYLRQSIFTLAPPFPGIIERLRLSAGFAASRRRVENVMGRAGVKRRVEVDQVYRRCTDISAQHMQIVAEIEG